VAAGRGSFVQTLLSVTSFRQLQESISIAATTIKNFFIILLFCLKRCKNIPRKTKNPSRKEAIERKTLQNNSNLIFLCYFCPAAAKIGTRAAEEKQYKDYDLLLYPCRRRHPTKAAAPCLCGLSHNN
jgi:hypothetical protein